MALLSTELFDFFSCLQLSQTGKFQIASNQENLQLKPPKVLSLQSALLLMCPPCPTPAGLAACAGLLHPSNFLPAQPCPSIHSGRRGSQGEPQQRAHLAYSLFLMHFSGCWGHFVHFCSFRRTQSPHLGWSETDFITRPSSHIPLCCFSMCHYQLSIQCGQTSPWPAPGPLSWGHQCCWVALAVWARPGCELGTLSSREAQSLSPGTAPSS